MDETIQQSELRNNNAEIMRRVAEGDSFTITVHGRAVADLVPHQRGRRRRRLVPASEFDGLLEAAGEAPDAAAWAEDVAGAAAIFGEDVPADPWEPGTPR